MKDIFGYILCVGIAVLMAVMIDGSGGVLIACILLIALIVSEVYKRYFRKKLAVSIDCKHKLLSKGDIVEVKVLVRKLTKLPSPIIELELEASPQLSPTDKPGMRFSILPGRDNEALTISFRADYSGSSYIRLKRFEVADFLGLGRYSAVTVTEDNYLDLKIMPTVRDTGTQAEVIRTATDNIGFDDSEDETSETAMGSTGTPGYEHRSYNPGDPLKKINWKLSSKRGIYMVRLDEKLSVTSQIFILDHPSKGELTAQSCEKADLIIEGVLAMLSMLAQQGLETDLYYYLNKWEKAEIKSLGDVYLLAESLSALTPYPRTERIPPEALKKGTALCFTTIQSEDQSLASELFSYNGMAFIVGEDSGFDTSYGDLWVCTKDYEFKHLN